MSEHVILLAECSDYDAAALEQYASLGKIVRDVVDRADLLKKIATATILVVRLGYHIDREVIEAASRLEMIVSPTTGLNHIDMELAQKRGIAVLSLRGETEFLDSISATAELTWGVLLALVRSIPAAHDHVRDGGWNRDLFIGRQLRAKTLGIVGLGRIGRMVARYGQAFGMQVIATDPMPRQPSLEFVKLCSHEELYRAADVVSVHVPFGPQTRGMIDRSAIGLMRAGSYLVNTSRGEIIDEHALLEALRSGHIAGAALDVLCDEPEMARGWPHDHPLLSYAREHRNLIVTPHVGGAAVDALRATEAFMAYKLVKLVTRRTS